MKSVLTCRDSPASNYVEITLERNTTSRWVDNQSERFCRNLPIRSSRQNNNIEK